jgi:signal transduction histidine kinase
MTSTAANHEATDRETAWTATRVAFDRRDRFAAYVAHELRTLIALQRAQAEAALADPDAAKLALRATCEGIVAGCEQQRRLVEALLGLTDSRRGLTCREPVDLAAIASQALRAHEPGELDAVVSLEPAVAIGDPVLLERLAANLISNAIRHNLPCGRIEVATRRELGRAVLAVANTGPLIPADELSRLFQPFERLDSQRRAGADGAGLGLAIVQSVADAHNASVAAHPRRDGGLEIEVAFRSGVAGTRPSRRLGAAGSRAGATTRRTGGSP